MTSGWAGKHMLCGVVFLDGDLQCRAHIGIDAPGFGVAKVETGRWLLSLPPHPEGVYLLVETRPATDANDVAKWVDRLPESDAYRVGFDKLTLEGLKVLKTEPFNTAFNFMLVWED